MRSRRAPRRLSPALQDVRERVAPQTVLAAVQGAWRQVAGAPIAAQAEPVAERDGVVTIACRSASWAQELDLMQSELLRRLEAKLGSGRVRGLRFTADAARGAPATGAGAAD